MQTNSKLLSYVFFGLAILAVIANFTGFIGEGTLVSLLGFFGFSGIAALRKYIDSQGFKTYLVAGLAILATVAQALIPGTIDPEFMLKFLGFLGVVAGSTTVASVTKAKNGNK